jgi:cation-transporting P-type ATPase 13A2
MFSGPVSESVPSSVVSFSHRRIRNDSIANSTHFQGEDDSLEWPDENAPDALNHINGIMGDMDATPDTVRTPNKQARTLYSHDSLEDPLLSRRGSVNSFTFNRGSGRRLKQTVYIVSEDLSATFTGYSTSMIGGVLYVASCIFSFGFAYLLFRWLPRWRMWLMGSPTPLYRCQWIGIEVSNLFVQSGMALSAARINGSNSQFKQFLRRSMDDRYLPSSGLVKSVQSSILMKITIHHLHL